MLTELDTPNPDKIAREAMDPELINILQECESQIIFTQMTVGGDELTLEQMKFQLKGFARAEEAIK